MINAIANPTMPEVGERYLGTVVKTTTFGAFVSLMPGKDGLLHISQLRKIAGGKRVENVEDVVKVGDKIQVEIAEIDPRGKLSLVPGRRGRRRRGADGAGRRRGVPRRRAGRRSLGATSEPVAPGRCSPGADGGGRPPHRPARRAAGRHRGDAGRALGRRSASGSASARATRRPRWPARSHYLEHLLFKGTKRRGALEISAALDAVGGEMNAFTAKEYTCYYARVLDADLPLAVDVVCDMVTVVAASRTADVEAERGVILEEIAMHDDDPGDVVHDVFAAGAVRRHPARPAGPRHRRLDRRAARARRSHGYYRRRYRPEQHGRRGRRQRRPRRGRPPGDARRSAGRLLDGDAAPSARAARRRRHAPRPPAGVDVVRPADRAGQPRPRRARRCPRRRAPLRPRRAQRRARRRHELAAVPGGPREARPGLLGLLATPRSTPTPACSASTPAASPSEVDEVLEHLPRRSSSTVAARRHHRRGARAAARASCAARSCSAWRTPARG